MSIRRDWKVGDRVGCVHDYFRADDPNIRGFHLYGFGTIQGCEVPPKGVFHENIELRRINEPSMKILLDNGEVIYRCECLVFEEPLVKGWTDRLKTEGREPPMASVQMLRKALCAMYKPAERAAVAKEYLEKKAKWKEQNALWKYSTRELLGFLRRARIRVGNSVDSCADDEIASLKEELAKREHVPNKQERKQMRRAQALKNRGQGKNKNR